jgi:hypothetical protein
VTSPLAPIPGPVISAKDMLTPVWRSWFNQLYVYVSAASASAFTQAQIQITESQVTGLTVDLAAKAALASPALTGTPTVNGVALRTGTGSPNSAVTGNIGDLYLNTSGGAGTTLYVKESGAGTNTGWVGK